MSAFVEWLFQCWHRKTTFPFSPPRRVSGQSVASAAQLGMYVVCLDCGKKLPYDWCQMRIRKEQWGPEPQPQRAPTYRPGFH